MLLVLLFFAASASLLAALLPGASEAGGWRRRLQDAWPVLAGALLAAVVVTLALRVARAGLARRGQGRAARALRPIEGVVAAVAIVAALAALTGNAGSALVSLGLLGFGLTLALQRPILSVAGWVAIQAARLFREGDRIEVMGIAGDVIEVNVFTTKLWEIGTSASPLPSGGASTPNRPSGRVVTLSNATFLEHPIANSTGDVSHIFDEFSVGVAYEADVDLARTILESCAAQVLDLAAHERAAVDYRRLTQGMEIEASFPREPQVIESLQESWIELRLRYLVPARSRAATRTALSRAWLDATRPHADRLPNVYPRVQPQNVDAAGRAISRDADRTPPRA